MYEWFYTHTCFDYFFCNCDEVVITFYFDIYLQQVRRDYYIPDGIAKEQEVEQETIHPNSLIVIRRSVRRSYE